MTKSDNEWQRVINRVTANDNERQSVTPNDDKWWQMTMSDSEWQGVVQQMKTNESK